MKQLIYLLLFTILSSGLVSCEDNRMQSMVEDKIYLLKSGFQVVEIYNSKESSFDIVVCKAGIGISEAKVVLSVNEQLLTDYNTTNGTSYKLLPSTHYALQSTEELMSSKDSRVFFHVTFDTQKIIDIQSDKEVEYVLPFILEETTSLSVDSLKSTILLAPKIED